MELKGLKIELRERGREGDFLLRADDAFLVPEAARFRFLGRGLDLGKEAWLVILGSAS